MNKQISSRANINTKEIIEELTLETIVANVIKINGAKVDRNSFLEECFKCQKNVDLQEIIEKGPIGAGLDEKTILKTAEKLIIDRSIKTSFKSFLMGIPGGVAILATLPADTIQFYGMTLRIAQELSYLYGADSLWVDGKIDEERVRNQLILYCGVMFGVSGATAGVRLISSQIAKTVLKKLPQKALTKTFWYPIIKKIGKAVGVRVTKNSLSSGVSKVVPFVGGAISGALTFSSMKPMAERLCAVFNQANYHYQEEDLEKDVLELENIDKIDEEIETIQDKKPFLGKSKEKVSAFFKKKNKETDELEKIKKLKELLDVGAITQEEFETKKKQILGL